MSLACMAVGLSAFSSPVYHEIIQNPTHTVLYDYYDY